MNRLLLDIRAAIIKEIREKIGKNPSAKYGDTHEPVYYVDYNLKGIYKGNQSTIRYAVRREYLKIRCSRFYKNQHAGKFCDTTCGNHPKFYLSSKSYDLYYCDPKQFNLERVIKEFRRTLELHQIMMENRND